MITTMNNCKYPEIKFISFLIFSQYQMRIKNFYKNKRTECEPSQFGSSREQSSRDKGSSSVF